MAKYVTFMPDGITLRGRSKTITPTGMPVFTVPDIGTITDDFDWTFHVPGLFLDNCNVGSFLAYDVKGAEWTGEFKNNEQEYAITSDHAVVTISVDYQNYMFDQLTYSSFYNTDTYVLRYNLVLDINNSNRVYWDRPRTEIQNNKKFMLNEKVPYCYGYTFLGWSSSPLGAPIDSVSEDYRYTDKTADIWVPKSKVEAGGISITVNDVHQVVTLYAIWKDNATDRMVIPSGIYITKSAPTITPGMYCGGVSPITTTTYPSGIMESPFEFRSLMVHYDSQYPDSYQANCFTGLVIQRNINWLGGNLYNVVLFNFDGMPSITTNLCSYTPAIYLTSCSVDSSGGYESYAGGSYNTDSYLAVSPYYRDTPTARSAYNQTIYFEHLPFQVVETAVYTYLAVNAVYEPGNKKISGRYLVYATSSAGYATQYYANNIFPAKGGTHTVNVHFSAGGLSSRGSYFSASMDASDTTKLSCGGNVIFQNGNSTSSSNFGWDFNRTTESYSHIDYTPQSVPIPFYCFMQLVDSGEFCYPGRIYGTCYDMAGFHEMYWSLPDHGEPPTEIVYGSWEDSYETSTQAIQVFADGKFLAEIPYCSPAEYANNDYFSEKFLHVPTALPLIPPDCACLYFRGVTRSMCTGGDYQNCLLMIPSSVNTVEIPEPWPAVMSDNKLIIDTYATAKYHEINYIGLEHGESGTITIESNMFDFNTFDDYVTHDDRYEFTVTSYTPITTQYGNPYAARAESPMSATVEYYHSSPYIIVKLPSTRGYIILDTKDKICEKNIKVKLL